MRHYSKVCSPNNENTLTLNENGCFPALGLGDLEDVQA